MNKKGKVKDLKPSQKVYPPWRLVVVDPNGKRRGKVFKSYKKAKKTATKLKATHPDSEYTIVSRQIGYGPPFSKVSDEDILAMNARGRYWCPYCRKFRIFDWDPWWGAKGQDRCPVCGTPESSWHVVRNNPRLRGVYW